MDYHQFSNFYYNSSERTYVFGVDSSADVYKFLAERKHEWKAVTFYIHNFYYDSYGPSNNNDKQTLEQFQNFINSLDPLKKVSGWERDSHDKLCHHVLIVCKENGISEMGYEFFIRNEEWSLANELFHTLPIERMLVIYPKDPEERKVFNERICTREVTICFFPQYVCEREKREALEAEIKELRHFPGGPEYQEALKRFTLSRKDI